MIGGIFKRAGYHNWYYRYQVPVRWRELFGTRQIRINLNTEDKATATNAALQHAARIAETIRKIQQPGFQADRIDIDLVRAVAAFVERDYHNYCLELLQAGLGRVFQPQPSPKDMLERFQTLSNRTIIFKHDQEAALEAVQAGFKAARARLTALRDDPSLRYVTDPLPAPTQPVVDRSSVLLDTIRDHFVKRQEAAGKKVTEVQQSFRRLGEFLRSPKPTIGMLNRAKLAEFRDLLMDLPVTRNHATKAINVYDLSELEGERVAPATVVKQLSVMAAAFNLALSDGIADSNPFAGFSLNANKVQAKIKRRGYRDDEAKSVLQLVDGIHNSNPRLFWFVRLAALTGARREELAQLKREDFFSQEGFEVFEIHDRGENATKNETSNRIVPVPQKLIDLGFLTWVRSQSGVIFASGQSQAKLRGVELYTDYRELIASLDFPRELVFHSWRHRMKTKCRSLLMPQEIHKRIVGHSDQSVSAGYGEFPIATLKEWIDKVDY